MSMRFVALVLALGSGSVAGAQTTGSLIQNRGNSSSVSSVQLNEQDLEMKPDVAALNMARGVAACVEKSAPEKVDALLGTTESAAFEAAWKPVQNKMSTCFYNRVTWDANLRMTNNLVRSLMAEARFRRLGAVTLTPVDYASVVEGSDWITDDAGAKVVLRTADCVAARKPIEAAALLQTVPDSADEKTRFAALVPALGTCLETGVTLKANRPGMRLALASALDRGARMTGGSAAKRD
jgi:hypothetical protein